MRYKHLAMYAIMWMNCCLHKGTSREQIWDMDNPVAYFATIPQSTFQQYLHTVNPINHSPLCTQCDQGGSQKESVSRFLSTCPKFHHARTAAHGQVCKVLATSPHKHLAAHWFLPLETPLGQTGLVLELVPAAIVLQSGGQVSDSDTTALQMSLGRWQAGFMAISYSAQIII